MTPDSIVRTAVANAGKTLHKILIDFPLDSVNEKAHASMFTTYEAVSHITECYVAFAAHAKGEEHQWGSFSSEATSYAEDIEELFRTRDAVTALITVDSKEDALASALDYLVAHDWYHIGQLATNRQAFETTWNSFSLYS